MANFDFESGRRYLEEGDLAESIRCFLASLDLDPSHVPGYVELLRAYEQAWRESGDPMILDQMRKVALAGLRRSPEAHDRRHLQDALDRVDALLVQIQQEEDEQESRRPRSLPMLPGDGHGGSSTG